MRSSLKKFHARRLLPLALLSLGLAGCATYRSQPLDPAASAMAFEARTLTDPGLTRFLQAADPSGHGWTLARLTLVGLYERPDILIAQDQRLMAQGGLQNAAALPNPTLSLTPTYNATKLMPSPWKAGPILSFLVTSLAARPAEMQAAKAHLAAAREALPIAAWLVRSQVRTAMLNLWTTEKSQALDVKSQALAQQSVALITARVNAGQMSEVNENTAILAADQSVMATAAIARSVVIARAQLALSVGLPAASLRHVRIDFAGFAHPKWPKNIGKLQQYALTSQPNIQVALDNYAQAQARLRLAILAQYPGISIGPGYNYDQGANKYILALSITLPIFNQNQGGIATAYAARALAGAQFLAAQQSVLDRIDQAMADARASADEVRAADAIRQNAKRQQISLAQQYNAGAIGRLRLTGGQRALVQAEQGLSIATLHLDDALGALEDALYHPIFGVRPGS